MNIYNAPPVAKLDARCEYVLFIPAVLSTFPVQTIGLVPNDPAVYVLFRIPVKVPPLKGRA